MRHAPDLLTSTYYLTYYLLLTTYLLLLTTRWDAQQICPAPPMAGTWLGSRLALPNRSS